MLLTSAPHIQAATASPAEHARERLTHDRAQVRVRKPGDKGKGKLVDELDEILLDDETERMWATDAVEPQPLVCIGSCVMFVFGVCY